jgi:hypothetical protein
LGYPEITAREYVGDEERFTNGVLRGDVNGDRIADVDIRIFGALTGGDVIL